METPATPRPASSDLERPVGLAQRSLSSTGLVRESIVVLLLSLGASAIWSALSLINKLTQQVALNQQTTAMNNSVTPDRPWLDLTYQLVTIALALVPVALALLLLSRDAVTSSPFARIGWDLRAPAQDVWRGAALAAAIGIPGLGLYAAARALGVNTTIAAANLADHWWTIPVLILAATQNAILEEVVMVGYLFTRWTQAGWKTWPIIVTSALIRGSYHLYQGFGGFVGNAVMGVAFGWLYTKTKRVGPLVVAHTLLDIVAFVGYAALKPHLSWL